MIVIDKKISNNVLEKERIRKEKHEGKNFELDGKTYKISFRSDDANGLLQIESSFKRGIEKTIMNFSNGTKLPLNKNNFDTFAIWFIQQRNFFFK